MLAYLDHAERHYRSPDDKPTSELSEVKVVIRALRELYAATPAANMVSIFGWSSSPTTTIVAGESPQRHTVCQGRAGTGDGSRKPHRRKG